VRLVDVGAETEGLGFGEEGRNGRAVEGADSDVVRAEHPNPNRTKGRFDFVAGHLSVSVRLVLDCPAPMTGSPTWADVTQ